MIGARVQLKELRILQVTMDALENVSQLANKLWWLAAGPDAELSEVPMFTISVDDLQTSQKVSITFTRILAGR